MSNTTFALPHLIAFSFALTFCILLFYTEFWAELLFACNIGDCINGLHDIKLNMSDFTLTSHPGPAAEKHPHSMACVSDDAQGLVFVKHSV